jgi:hypothetical protein
MFTLMLSNYILGSPFGTVIYLCSTLFIFLFSTNPSPPQLEKTTDTIAATPTVIKPVTKKEPLTVIRKPKKVVISEKIDNFNSLLEKENNLPIPKKVVNLNYKGAVDHETGEEDYGISNNKTIQYGEDKIAALQLKHRGVNLERQLAGGYNKMSVMKPMLEEELHNEEYSVWWGNNDK